MIQVYNKILQEKFAKNIEMEILHLPFYFNHLLSPDFAQMKMPSPFLISAKHPTDSTDMAQEIARYVYGTFMSKIALKEYDVKGSSLSIFLDSINQQTLNTTTHKYSMIYFVNSTNSSVYANGYKILSEVSGSDVVFVENNDTVISIENTETQCVIIANMEDLNG
jgi:hypothetical protein